MIVGKPQTTWNPFILTVRNNQNQLGKAIRRRWRRPELSWGWLLVARSAEVTHNSESGDRSASSDGPGKSNKQHDRANYGRAYHRPHRAGPYHLFTRQTKLCELRAASKHSHATATRHERDLFPLCCLVSHTADQWSVSELNSCCKYSSHFVVRRTTILCIA